MKTETIPSRLRLMVFVAQVLLSPISVMAQLQVPATNADQQFTALLTLAAPSTSPRSPARSAPTPAQLTAQLSPQATQFRQAAQAAKDFALSFASDPRVPQAKKLEVTCLLRSVLPGASDQWQTADRAATSYRADKANAAADRFEVATLAESQRYFATTNGATLSDNAAAQERVADALRTEFGDTPGVIAYYLGVVESSDFDRGARLAQKIMSMTAVDKVKRQAQTELDRHALIGKPMAVALKATDGKTVNLDAPGDVTVVYVWSERHGAKQWAALAQAKAILPSKIRWVYLALDAKAAELERTMKSAPFAGTVCSEPNGPKGASLKNLKIRCVPYVYVVNAKGALVGYGPPAQLPSLLRAAAP